MALNTTPTHPQANSYVTLEEADEYIQGTGSMDVWNALNEDQKEAALKIATRHIDSLRFFHERIYTGVGQYRDRQKLQFPRHHSSRNMSGQVSSAGADWIIDVNQVNRNDTPDDFWNGGALVVTEGAGKGKTYKIEDFDMATGKVTVEENFSPAVDATSYFRLIQKVPDEVKYATVEQALYNLNGGGERAKMQAEGVKSYSIGDLSETFGTVGGGATVSISSEARGYLRLYISKIGKLL